MSGLTDFMTAGGSDLVTTAITAAENRRSMERQMDFQAAQSETAYQRSVRDMKLAGLNPAMMYAGSGGPAMSMGGSSVGAPESNAVETALSARRLNEELNVMRQTTLTGKAQESLNKMLEDKAAADKAVSENSASNLAIQNKILAAQLPAYLNVAEVEKGKMGKWLAYADRALKTLQPAASVARDVAIPFLLKGSSGKAFSGFPNVPFAGGR